MPIATRFAHQDHAHVSFILSGRFTFDLHRDVADAVKALGQDVVLTHVYDGGAAQLAGLSAGDVIVAVSGIRATAGELEGKIARVPEGESILVTAFRRDELMEFQVTPRMACADTCALWLMDDVDQEIQENRNNWLSTVSTH